MIIPNDEKKHRGGEDAAATSDTMLIVSDGVGGWALQGVNPGLFSRKLVMETLARHFDNWAASPKQAITHGLEIAAREYAGSATVLAMKIRNGNTI